VWLLCSIYLLIDILKNVYLIFPLKAKQDKRTDVINLGITPGMKVLHRCKIESYLFCRNGSDQEMINHYKICSTVLSNVIGTAKQ
jgi:hypothetical protein